MVEGLGYASSRYRGEYYFAKGMVARIAANWRRNLAGSVVMGLMNLGRNLGEVTTISQDSSLLYAHIMVT